MKGVVEMGVGDKKGYLAVPERAESRFCHGHVSTSQLTVLHLRQGIVEDEMVLTVILVRVSPPDP